MVILASSSPRRKELLKKIYADFIVDYILIDESQYAYNDIAYYKGLFVAKNHPDDIVISADTQVVFNHQIYGKPVDKEDAKRMLKIFSNKRHAVITYFAIIVLNKGIFYQGKTVSYVTFKELDEYFIEKYVASLSPLDKAGAYGIQDDEKYHFIAKLEGDKDNVIGLPVDDIKNALINLELL